MEYLVTQEDGTEPPFQNEYWNHFEKGVYVDKISGKNGAAMAASRCMNVPNAITMIPISSSLYSSNKTPHSEQR